ncbi:uncharacterized protein LOC111038636 [Myzus persicae]|uniref:uncharacterized protein LOC111038636 n=1 Tax=Myzus persicae TaxID=13164 RepID=UPI000B9318A9|nr:uncharacterized protein LOC111038636 [Myzus persicae]
MSPAHHEELRENDITLAGPPSHHRRAQSGLRAGASPERRAGDRGCPNACRRDDRPVDCKTQSVRRRLAEELGCCGCTKVETPCLVTEGASICCQRRPSAPKCCPEPNASPTAACVDPVDQIINEGLMQQKKKSSRRRSSCCSSSNSRPRDPCGRERRARVSMANQHSYQPDFFDDQADMSNWQEHRDVAQQDVSRGRPSSAPPRPKCLAFEPYVDNGQYSEAAVGSPIEMQPDLQNENDDRQQTMQRELERLNEQRAHLVECLEREMKIIEMMREYKKLKRASARTQLQQPLPNPSADDRQRIQRLIDEERRKLAEFQRRPQQQGQRCPATPTGTYEIPWDMPPSPDGESACAAASTPPRQRRRLTYQPPSPDTDTEDECCAPPPRRRLLAVLPISPGDSSDGGANECGRRTPAATSRCSAGPSRDQESSRRPQSSLQDSLMYYYRAIRNGAPPVTADVPQQTSSTWTGCSR